MSSDTLNVIGESIGRQFNTLFLLRSQMYTYTIDICQPFGRADRLHSVLRSRVACLWIGPRFSRCGLDVGRFTLSLTQTLAPLHRPCCHQVLVR